MKTGNTRSSHAEKESKAYSEGLKLGKLIMDGCVGATQRHGAGGKFFFDEAAKTARFLGIPETEVQSKIIAFHKERIDSEPDPAKYPEAKGTREILLKKYAGLKDGGLSDFLVAASESLGFWRQYRLRKEFGRVYMPFADDATSERCRIVYLPNSAHGTLHFKNIDDPLKTWVPKKFDDQIRPWPYSPLMYDGVGNGLHIDEDAEEIFPLDALALSRECCETVEEVKEFLVRYNHFWHGASLLVHDDNGNSVAFDKASRNRIAVREPHESGLNYVNGMSSFDKEYQSFIRGQRMLYLKESGQSEDSPEGTYFKFTENLLNNMQRYMYELDSEPTLENLKRIMDRRDPDGPMCKSGKPVHPQDPQPAATLMQQLYFIDEKRMLVRQWRGETPVWEDKWEEIIFS